jgi:hypothetical protein
MQIFNRSFYAVIVNDFKLTIPNPSSSKYGEPNFIVSIPIYILIYSTYFTASGDTF